MPIIVHRTVGPGVRLGVWHATEDPGALMSLLKLDASDEQLLVSIGNINRRRQWLACRAVLSVLLGTPSVGIRYTGYGKPMLVSSPGNISFSHTGNYSAAILSESSVPGIDLEQVRDRIIRVSGRFLSPGELGMVPAGEQTAVLTLFWAVKEAVYKIHEKPDLDLQHDICIESFDYLCATGGEVTTRITGQGLNSTVSVNYQRLNGCILAWATVPQKC